MRYKYTRHSLTGHGDSWDHFESPYNLNAPELPADLAAWLDREEVAPRAAAVYVIRKLEVRGIDTRVVVLQPPPVRETQVGELAIVAESV